MARILSLTARLGFDGSGFKKGMDNAKTQASQLKTELAGAFKAVAAYASIGALTNFSREIVKMAGDVSDIAESFQITTDQLQEMHYWAVQNASSIEDVAKAMELINKARVEALGGNKEKLAAFQSFGVSGDDLTKMSPYAIMSQINKSAMSQGQGGAAAGMDAIFGKSAQRLAAAFQASMKEAGDAAREAGYILDSVTLVQLAQLDDQLSVVWKILQTAFAPVLLDVVKVMVDAYDILTGIGKGIGKTSAGFMERYSAGYDAREKQQAEERARRFTPNIGKKFSETYSGKPTSIFDVWRRSTMPLVEGAHGLFSEAKEWTGINALSKTAAGYMSALGGAASNVGGAVSANINKREEERKASIARIRQDMANRAAGVLNWPWRIDPINPPPPPSMLGVGSVSQDKIKNTIQSDAFAKIGGFVGPGAGGVNHLKETADATKGLLMLAKGNGLKTIIKE